MNIKVTDNQKVFFDDLKMGQIFQMELKPGVILMRLASDYDSVIISTDGFGQMKVGEVISPAENANVQILEPVATSIDFKVVAGDFGD